MRLDQRFPGEFVFPDYGRLDQPGHTIANVPATIGRLLGIELPGLPPLPESFWRPLLEDGPLERIVLIILDAVGRNLFPPQAAPMSHWLPDRPLVNHTISSVAPSTTVNALSCLWTGTAPAQHGLLGVRLHFPEYGVVANMLKMHPNALRGREGLLEAGFDGERFLATPGLAQNLRPFGIETYSFKPQDILKSALSQMHDRGTAAVIGSISLAEMMWQIGDLLTRRPGQPLLAVGYWPSIDTLSHRYGRSHAAIQMELSVLLAQINEMLIQSLAPPARQKTAVLIIADHGQMELDLQHAIDLEAHPLLRQGILLDGPGEPRKPYLYVRHGKLDEIQNYLTQKLFDVIIPMTAGEALAEGWFGPGPHAPQTAERLGDLIGFMRPTSTFIPRVDRPLLTRMVGMHGGLSPDEMFVPFWGMTL